MKLDQRKPRSEATINESYVEEPNGVDVDKHLGLLYTLANWASKVYDQEFGYFDGMVYLALKDAARTFKPEKGFRFSTHAVRTVKWKLYTWYMEEQGHKRRGNKFAIVKTEPIEEKTLVLPALELPQEERPSILEGLPEDDQDIFYLYFEKKLTLKQIAKLYQVSPQWISYRLKRIKAVIATRLRRQRLSEKH